jgi:class 3 adenylate cyclase
VVEIRKRSGDQRRDAFEPVLRHRHHRVEFGRYLADSIPNAKYVELSGADSFPFHAGDFKPLLDEVEEFLTGTRAPPVLDRRLATILLTDVVGSTRLAAERGDSAWIGLVRSHDEIVRGIRVGLHTGEIEVAADAVRGLAVHIAARVMSAAERGGILASATVKDLEIGPGIEFADRGTRRLKGIPGDWRLFEVASTA